MKAIVQAAVSACALAALLGSVASQATPLAELPLKASVLAKPNVIFAMDDSGSMDWEIVLGTDDGLAWWNGSSAAWDTTNNRPLESTSDDKNEMAYLFPMGSDDDYSGGQMYSNTSAYGRAVPPIGQLAWLRANATNPLYYNTMVTYPAWAPAYVNSAMRSYSDVPTNAAPGHPGPFASGAKPVRTLDVGSDQPAGSSDAFAFNAMPGMVLPTGTSVVAKSATSRACDSSGSRVTLTAPTAAVDYCQARIPYFPATFWQRTVCPAGDTACVAAPDCTVVDPAVNPLSACVNSPDGVGKLRRYEIRSGNTFPSGRTYAQELQNFANWFTYYRKRKLMLAGAMGRTLEPITGLRLGVVPLNNRSSFAGPMWDADDPTASKNNYVAAGQFYLNAMTPKGTPTRGTIKYIGDLFNTKNSDSTKDVVQYACQRNSMFVVTDGFANDDAPTIPSYSSATYGAAAPYQTTASGSMADQALAYFTNRLRTDLTAGQVPPGDPLRANPDLNTDLHITTYGITLGARGKLFPTALNPFAVDVFATPPTWPTPVKNDPTMIDDLWHATVNGRGKMFLAADVETMRQSLQSAFSDIQNQQGAQGSVAVSAVNLDRGDSQAYLASYNPAGWTGDLWDPLESTCRHASLSIL